MYLSFGRRLRGLGGFRFGVGVRMKGWTGALMTFMYAMLYLLWYMLLGTLWLIYGLGYVCYYLPAKYLVKYCKDSKRKKEIEDAKRKCERPTD